MKKLLVIISLVMLVGCGIRESKTVERARSVDSLTVAGWRYYSKGLYDSAETRFDSAIAIDVRYVDALIGGGWTKMKLQKYSDGYAYLDIALSMLGGTPVRKSYNAKFDIVDTFESSVRVGNRISDVMYFAKPRDLKNGSVILMPEEIEIEGYGGAKLLVADVFDTGLGVILDSPFVYSDSFVVTYYYCLAGDSSQGDVFAGKLAGYMLQERYTDAIKNGRACLRVYPDYKTKYWDYIHLDRNDILLLLAKCYFDLGMYSASINRLLKISSDTSWVPDVNDPYFVEKVLSKINELSLGK